jgi:hypothetical protein
MVVPVTCMALGQFSASSLHFIDVFLTCGPVGFMVYSVKAYNGHFDTFAQITTLKVHWSLGILIFSV